MDRSNEIRLQVMLERLIRNYAIKILDRWNDERKLSKDWPGGQSWDELAATSQTTLLRHACEELDLDFDFYKKIHKANNEEKAVSQIIEAEL